MREHSLTLPIAGWYPDPQDPMRTRWWDGARWGQLAAAPQSASSPEPSFETAPRPPAPSEYRPRVDGPAVLRGRAARVAKDRATRAANPFGWTGLVLALIALIVDVFAVPGVLGIVFGGVGLIRAGQIAGQRITGFGASLAAVIIGLAATTFFLTSAAQLLA